MDFTNTDNLEVLWIYFTVYGIHEAGIKICDQANTDKKAMEYAKRIWRLNEKL